LENETVTRYSAQNLQETEASVIEENSMKGEKIMQHQYGILGLNVSRQQVARVAQVVLLLAVAVVAFHAMSAFAADTGISIEGAESKHAALKPFGNLGQTVIHVLTQWAAPVLGACLVLFGVYKLAVRDAVPGSIAVLGGGMLIGIGKAIAMIKDLMN
jgi:hypothetical protein